MGHCLRCTIQLFETCIYDRMITTRHLGVLGDVEAGLLHPPIHSYATSTICQLLI